MRQKITEEKERAGELLNPLPIDIPLVRESDNRFSRSPGLNLNGHIFKKDVLLLRLRESILGYSHSDSQSVHNIIP